jgi:cytidine deaminase
VGAVVVAADGTLHHGCNVENAAYGSSMCAEATAIGAAVAAGVHEIEAVVIACLDDDAACYPCGNCRQLMNEFGVARVVVQDGKGGCLEHSFAELFPNAFGPDDLR